MRAENEQEKNLKQKALPGMVENVKRADAIKSGFPAKIGAGNTVRYGKSLLRRTKEKIVPIFVPIRSFGIVVFRFIQAFRIFNKCRTEERILICII